MPWGKEREDDLKNCLEKGMKLRDLAAHFEVSESALRGKLNRMGYSLKGLSDRKKSRTTKRSSTKGCPGLPAKASQTEPDTVSFADLKDYHCRWPCGDPKRPGFGFCGQERFNKNQPLRDVTYPYCWDHYVKATQPTRGVSRQKKPQNGAKKRS